MVWYGDYLLNIDDTNSIPGMQGVVGEVILILLFISNCSYLPTYKLGMQVLCFN